MKKERYSASSDFLWSRMEELEMGMGLEHENFMVVTRRSNHAILSERYDSSSEKNVSEQTYLVGQGSVLTTPVLYSNPLPLFNGAMLESKCYEICDLTQLKQEIRGLLRELDGEMCERVITNFMDRCNMPA